MTDPAEGRAHDEGDNPTETTKLNDETAATHVTIEPEDNADDSKLQLINGGANGGGDPGFDVKVVDGTATSSEAEVSFSGLGKDEVMRYADEPFWKKLRLILFILFWIGWFAMLVTAIIIIVMAPRCPPRPDLKWYQTDAVYQVLPKSFKDSDGDGKGDFKGLKDKSDYVFTDLGANAILLSSMYKSDGLDSGLGIEDHKAVADWFKADSGDIKSWAKSLLKEGKRIILDLVPNQTSKKHPWFVKSQKEEGKYTNYYVWAPKSNSSSPPNNWKNVDGDSAWSLDPVRNTWYLHQFSEDHPDLNLHNPDVQDEIKDIMRFWLDAGVSGFNVRGVEYLLEDKGLMDNDADLTQSRHNNATFGFLASLRKVIEDFSDKPGKERVLMATVTDPTREQALEYWGPKDSPRLHIVAPVMAALDSTTTAQGLKNLLEKYLTDDRKQWMGYAMGSPDVSRIASRMGTKAGLTIAHALQMLLPGTPINYYGDEFGQMDVAGVTSSGGRDAYRSPMQWDSSNKAGFTSGNTTWLPIGADYKTNHAAAGSALFSEYTPLKAFHDLLALRMDDNSESLQFGKTKLCSPEPDLLVFTRKAERFPYFLTLVNMGSSMRTFKLESLDCVTSKAQGKVRFHSRDDSTGEQFDFHEKAITLESGDVVAVEFSAE